MLSLESRGAEEMATLIGKYGGVPVVAPSMREQKLDLTRAIWTPCAAFNWWRAATSPCRR
ncbi:hypothetical protein [Deinococcus frigens]|uniref:hypothetical protein n=1 Tax=Deinococcus frigens TaxID=249403 RepID=UPI001FE099D2|nr:hypothetical protein [Deinococcus frigens]